MDTNLLTLNALIAVCALVIWLFLLRWILDIRKIVSNQEKQLRTMEETVIQNEKIIKLLSKNTI